MIAADAIALALRWWKPLAVLALVMSSFLFGRATMHDKCRASTVKTLQKAQRALDKAARAWAVRDAQLAAQDTARETEFREIVREIPTIVERPVYSGQCLDADGLQLIRRGVSAANGATSSGPDGGASNVR